MLETFSNIKNYCKDHHPPLIKRNLKIKMGGVGALLRVIVTAQLPKMSGLE